MTTPSKDCGGKGVSARKALNANTKQPWFKQGYLMNRAAELVAPLRYYHKQSNFISQLKVPKSAGSSTINMLTTSEEVLTFFNARPIHYSQLVPQIEIRKVYIKRTGKKPEDIKEVTFPFKSIQNFDDWNPSNAANSAVANKRFFRGTDAGIQSLDFKMEGRGRNPTQANIVRATIKFFFNDIKTLFDKIEDLDGDPKASVSFSDLIRYPPTLRKSRRSFRIRLVLGWSTNPSNPIFDDHSGGNNAFLNAVKSSKISIACDLISHDMEFNEDGSLTLTARYEGALESAFSSQAANILGGVSPSDKDPDLNRIKAQISSKRDKVNNLRMNPRQRQTDKDLKEIERLTQELQSIRETIQNALNNPKGKFPKGYDVKLSQTYTALGGAITAYNEARPGRRQRPPFKELKKIAAGTKPKRGDAVLKRSELESANAKKLAAEKRSLQKKLGKPKGDSLKKVRNLNKEIKRLKKQMAEYEKAMKGKHLFSYIEYLRLNNKLAWISTGRGSKFGNYEELVKVLNKAGGSKTKKDRRKIAAATARVNKETKDAAADLAGTMEAGMALTDYTGLDAAVVQQAMGAMFGAGFSINLGTAAAEFIAANISAAGKKSKKKERVRTGNGETIVWESSKGSRPTYKKGDKMYFFRLGDLLTAILDKGDFGKVLEEEVPNFRILLGEYDIPDAAGDGTYVRMSLYDLPISLEIFQTFVAQKIVGTGRNVYPLLQFTFDLIKFIMDKTQGVFGKSADFSRLIQNPVSFKMDMTSVELPKDVLEKRIKEDGDTIKLGSNKADTHGNHLTSLNVTAIQNTSNAFVLHAAMRKMNKGESIYKGNIAEDTPRGIFHFFVGGPNKGILKNINFSEVNNPKFAISLMRNGQEGGLESSWEGLIRPAGYTCNLTLVGNPFFYIGQMFYVNTELISGGNFRENGILNGGYYIVTSVDNSFTSDKWETKIRGVLQIPDHALAKYKSKDQAAVEKVSQKTPEQRKKLDAKTKKAEADKKNATRLGGENRRASSTKKTRRRRRKK